MWSFNCSQQGHRGFFEEITDTSTSSMDNHTGQVTLNVIDIFCKWLTPQKPSLMLMTFRNGQSCLLNFLDGPLCPPSSCLTRCSSLLSCETYAFILHWRTGILLSHMQPLSCTKYVWYCGHRDHISCIPKTEELFQEHFYWLKAPGVEEEEDCGCHPMHRLLWI